MRGIDIRNSTVQGRDVALNTLTGDDVNESRLGKVPSATAADSATTAGSAQNVRVIAPTSLARGATPVTLATHGPLTIALRCFAGHGRHERVDHGGQPPQTTHRPWGSSPEAA